MYIETVEAHLPFLQGQNTFLDGIFNDQPLDEDAFLLPETMHAIESLVLYRLTPPEIE